MNICWLIWLELGSVYSNKLSANIKIWEILANRKKEVVLTTVFRCAKKLLYVTLF